MKHLAHLTAAAFLLVASPALADACSGHSHDTGTALGAVGGGLIGGLASHSVAGGVAGAVVGGLAGNAISRSQDCNRRIVRHTSYYVDRNGHRHYYTR